MCWDKEPKVGAFWLARVPKDALLPLLPNPNPPALAAAVPSPNTLPPVEPSGLVKAGAEPNAGTPPNPGDPPKVGGLPNTGAAPKPPVLLGVEKPKPWDATLPPPAVKVPAGFCSPNEEPPKLLKVLAPLFPNRFEGFAVAVDPKPPLAELNGFLLAASWLGFPPRPLKKPPPRPALPDPNTLLLLLEDEAGWPKTVPPGLAAWPNRDPVLLDPKPEAWQKLKPDADAVVVAAEEPPNMEPPWPKLGLWPKAGALLWPNRAPPVPADGCPKEKDELLGREAAPKTLPLVEDGVEVAAWPKAGTELKPGWEKEKPLAGLLVACPKAGVCPKLCPKMPAAAGPKAELPKPELLTAGAVAAVLVTLLVCGPNRLGAVLAATCPNTGDAEGMVAALHVSWLKAELEEAAGG